MILWHLKFDSRLLIIATDGVITNSRYYGSEFLIHPYKFGLSIDLTIWIHNIEIGFYMILMKVKSNNPERSDL
jgi:hypothetical protein